ncbi:MAG: TonB-dependent receptor [Deltaproteobacteria bacterium]|nr:TonB-dependent receptor [Deltaproteobacteria bacterium]
MPVVLFVLWLLAVPARAQTSTTGAIQGVISDADTGDPLAGVTIVVTSEGSSAQSALTDGRGFYKITDLTPGSYLVSFYYLDFTVERPVVVGVQKVTAVYQKLNTAQAKGEVVKVDGTAPTIDPTSTAQGITIDKEYLKHIPVPGRTFESALGAAAGSQGDILGVAFSGSTSLENQYVVDGVNTTGLSYGTVGSPVINDFIEEIEIITGGYNAEYGRSTGGIVNVVTKSGSNELKGSVFGYFQPGQLTAATERTPRNATSIDVKRDVGYRTDFGFELGGPIIKDKLWFFVGLAPAFSRTDFTRDTKRQSDCRMVLADGTLSTCDNRLTSTGGFADGRPDIDPATGFFITDAVDTETRNATGRALSAIGKINYAATPEQQGQLALQAVPQSGHNPNLYGPEQLGTDSKGYTADMSAKWTSKLNDGKTEVEALLGVHRATYQNTAIDPALDQVPLQVMINGNLGVWGPAFGESQRTNVDCLDGTPGSADPYPFITNCPMNTRAYYIGGPGSLYHDTEQRVAARLGVTQRVKAGGSHEIKAGIDVENNEIVTTRSLSGGAFVQNRLGTQVDVIRWVQLAHPDETRGRFDNTCTTPPPPTEPGQPLMYQCDYLDGLPGADGTEIPGATLNWSAYLRDSWQIRPNLTLNIGLRYEEQRLRYAEFLRNQVDTITGVRNGKNAVVLKNQWAPRLGVLYDWTKEGRSKVYAHWGRFYESIPLEINNYNYGQPVQYLQSYSPSKCGMLDPNIGGPNAVGCIDTTQSADIRQELFGTNGSLTAPGLKGQYIDEWVGGFEYELIDDLKLGMSYQQRGFGRVIEDVSTDNARTYVVSNPGEWSAEEERKLQEKIDRTTDPVQKGRLETQMKHFRGIRTFDKPRRDYTALQLTMTRRFDAKLYVQASYTLSRTAGNYPGLISYDDGIVLPNNSTQYDLIELLANKIGPLPQDRPHYIKVDGYYTFDFKKAGDVTAGIRFRALSGAPKNALAAHYLYGDDQSFLLPRGTIGRADFEHGLDIHLGYGRKVRSNVRAEVFLDIYNVYNNQGVAAVDNTYATFVKQGAVGSGSGTLQAANPVVGGTYEDLIWVKTVDIRGTETAVPIGRNPNYLNTAARYAPLFARVGARITF